MTETRNRILELMKRRGPITIQFLSEELNMARSTVKEHLRLLEMEEWISTSREKRDMGRPVTAYSLTESGEKLFPDAHGQMLSGALKYIKNQLGQEGLHEFFRRFWSERLEEARRRLNVYDEDDYEGFRNELYEILKEQHFMPEIEWGGDGRDKNKVEAQGQSSKTDSDKKELVIKECNCPFPEAVEETTLPCKLEAEFFEKLLGARLERTSYIPDGYNACTYHIKIDEPEKKE